MGVGVLNCVGAASNVGVGEGKVVIGAAAVPARVAVRVGVSPGLPVEVVEEAGNWVAVRTGLGYGPGGGYPPGGG